MCTCICIYIYICSCFEFWVCSFASLKDGAGTPSALMAHGLYVYSPDELKATIAQVLTSNGGTHLQVCALFDALDRILTSPVYCAVVNPGEPAQQNANCAYVDGPTHEESALPVKSGLPVCRRFQRSGRC